MPPSRRWVLSFMCSVASHHLPMSHKPKFSAMPIAMSLPPTSGSDWKGLTCRDMPRRRPPLENAKCC